MATKPSATIPVEILDELKTEWLPQLRALRERRKSTVHLMMAAICVPLLFAVAIAALIIWEFTTSGKLQLGLAGICTMVLGIPGIAFVHLGKLQRCNDSLISVELFVHLRDRAGLINTLSKVECLGGLEGILHDAERLISAAR